MPKPRDLKRLLTRLTAKHWEELSTLLTACGADLSQGIVYRIVNRDWVEIYDHQQDFQYIIVCGDEKEQVQDRSYNIQGTLSPDFLKDFRYLRLRRTDRLPTRDPYDEKRDQDYYGYAYVKVSVPSYHEQANARQRRKR